LRAKVDEHHRQQRAHFKALARNFKFHFGSDKNTNWIDREKKSLTMADLEIKAALRSLQSRPEKTIKRNVLLIDLPPPDRLLSFTRPNNGSAKKVYKEEGSGGSRG
jgi:hypothetical protein